MTCARGISAVSIWIAVSSIGLLIGWLLGRSGPDASVIATVLPAIITALLPGFGLIIYLRLNKNRISKVLRSFKSQGIYITLVFLSVTVVVFSTSIYGGVRLGGMERANIVNHNANEALRATLLERELQLLACTAWEEKINNSRKGKGLLPLGVDYFCGYMREY